jgi:hypothetical protein
LTNGPFPFNLSNMARVHFTANLQRHVPAPTVEAAGGSVRAVLDQVFDSHPLLRGYVLDEHGALRKHMLVFVDDDMLVDRVGLSDTVPANAEIYVMQALSGG